MKAPDTARIIGLDPGTSCFGYAVLQLRGRKTPACIAVDTLKARSRTQNLENRLFKIYHALDDIFRQFNPDIVAIEQIFHHKNVKSAVTLAHSRGIGLLLSAKHDCRLLEYSPRKIKLAVTGTGGATKEQVRQMLYAMLDLKERKLDLDSSDALAAAVCGYLDLMGPEIAPAARAIRKKSVAGWTLEAIKARGLKIIKN